MKPSSYPVFRTLCAGTVLAAAIWAPLASADLRPAAAAETAASEQAAMPTTNPNTSAAPAITATGTPTITRAPTSSANMLEAEMIGGIDWRNNVVYGVGDGVPPANAISPAQARVRAKRAAIDEAMARLLETIKEVRVDAESTTRNFISEHRMVGNRVSGLIRNAEVIEIRQAEDGSFQVKMAMPLTGPQGLSAVLLPAQIHKRGIAASPAAGIDKVATVSVTRRPVTAPTATLPAADPAPASEPAKPEASTAPNQPNQTVQADPANQAEQSAQPETPAQPPTPADNQQVAETSAPYTALVIDARGQAAVEAMFPRILTRSGEVLYDVTIADPNATVAHGLANYGSSLAALPRAGDNPLVIKAVDVSGSAKADLVIADLDGEQINTANTSAQFLQQANVLILTD